MTKYEKFHSLGRWSMVLGGAIAILGALAIAMPFAVGVGAVMVVGAFLMAAGIGRMIWAFKAPTVGRGIGGFLFGTLSLLAGIGIVVSPTLGVVSLAVLLGAYFVADGIVEIIAAIRYREHSGWGWLLFGGFVALALGVLIFQQFPLSGVWAIGILVGVHLLMVGIGMIATGAAAGSRPAHAA